MAEPELRKGKWCFRFRDKTTGKRRLVTLAARTKGEARETMRAYLVKVERRTVGLERADPNPQKWTVEKLLKWWLAEFSAKLEAHESNQTVIKRHLLTSRLASLPLEAVTAVQIETLLHAKARELAPQSVNHLRSFLSRAFGRAKKLGFFIGENPVTGTEKRKVEDPLPVFLERAEVRQVLAVAATKQPQWVGLYATAFYCGLRKGELFALKPGDVDLTNMWLTVRSSHARKTTKSGRQRVVDIPDELLPFIKAQLRLNTRNLFPNPEGDQWHRFTRVDLRFAEALTNAGIERSLRFHDTRDTFASLFLMSGGDIVTLQELLGHASIETTRRRYGHLSRAYVRGQMKGFSMQEPAPTPARKKAPKPRRPHRKPSRRADPTPLPMDQQTASRR